MLVGSLSFNPKIQPLEKITFQRIPPVKVARTLLFLEPPQLLLKRGIKNPQMSMKVTSYLSNGKTTVKNIFKSGFVYL